MSQVTEVRIRPAKEQDAQALIEYVQELAQEPGIYLVVGPGEFNLSPEDEERYIANLTQRENSAIFLALNGERLVGEINLVGGTRRAINHTAVLGMSVRSGWRGRGIGTRLLDAALNWVRAGGVLKRIELRVFVENDPAIRLYEKFGFQKEGRRIRSIFRDGVYHDDWLMALLLNDLTTPESD